MASLKSDVNMTDNFEKEAAKNVLPTNEELKCEFLDLTMIHKGGVIQQFINSNYAGSTNLIRGIRH
jgi:hypothetical protein